MLVVVTAHQRLRDGGLKPFIKDISAEESFGLGLSTTG